MGDITENREDLFAEENTVISGEEIQMGEVVGDEGLVVPPLEVDNEPAPTAFMKDKFLDHIGEGVSYLMFDKSEILHFVKNVAFQAKTGFEDHAKSFKINMENAAESGKAKLVYNNGLTMCVSEVPCETDGDFKSCTVSIDSIVKSFVSSEGSLFLYADKDEDVYSYVFGGDVFVETFDMSGDDVTSDEKLVELLSPEPKEKHVLATEAIGMFADILPLVKLGKRPEERAIYFVEDKGFLYSGQVSAELSGIGLDLVLQEFDLETFVHFMSGVSENVDVEMHDSFVIYRSGGRILFLTKRTIELDDSAKYLESGSASVRVDGQSIVRVLNFLGSMQGVADNITLFGNVEGLFIDSPIMGKDGKHSKFPVDVMEGDVSKLKPVVLGLSGLRGFIRPLEGALDLSVARDCLFISDSRYKLQIRTEG